MVETRNQKKQNKNDENIKEKTLDEVLKENRERKKRERENKKQLEKKEENTDRSRSPPNTTPSPTVTPPNTTPSPTVTPPNTTPSPTVTPPNTTPSPTVTPPNTSANAALIIEKKQELLEESKKQIQRYEQQKKNIRKDQGFKFDKELFENNKANMIKKMNNTANNDMQKKLQELREKEEREKQEQKKNEEEEKLKEEIRKKSKQWKSQDDVDWSESLKVWFKKKVQLNRNLNTYLCNNTLFPHQEILKCITPGRFDKGALLDYMTGAGKTKSFVIILSKFFKDPRPKAFFGKKQNEVNNFLKELLEEGFSQEKSIYKKQYHLYLKYYLEKNNKNTWVDVQEAKKILEFNQKDSKEIDGYVSEVISLAEDIDKELKYFMYLNYYHTLNKKKLELKEFPELYKILGIENKGENYMKEILSRKKDLKKNTNKYFMFLKCFFQKNNIKKDLTIDYDFSFDWYDEITSKNLNKIKDILSLKNGFRNGEMNDTYKFDNDEFKQYEPVSPLRFFLYTDYLSDSESFRKFGYNDNQLVLGSAPGRKAGTKIRDKEKIFDDMIIVWDEFHYLWWKDPPGFTDGQKEKNKKFQRILKTRKNTVLIGATATPYINGVEDFDNFMSIITARAPPFVQDPRHFVFHFNDINSDIFPTNYHRDTTFGTELIKYNAIMSYKKIDLLNKDKKIPHEEFLRRSAIYENIGERKENLIPKSRSELNIDKQLEISLDFEIKCKLEQIVEDIKNSYYNKGNLKLNLNNEIGNYTPTKVLILTQPNEGFLYLQELLKRLVDKFDVFDCKEQVFSLYGYKEISNTKFFEARETRCKKENFKLRECDERARTDYNKNKRKCKLLIANADNYKEGVDFHGVTCLILSSPPQNYGDFLQKLGRVTRACRNNNIAFTVYTYCSYLDFNLKTQEEQRFEKIMQQKKDYDALDNRLYEISIQKEFTDFMGFTTPKEEIQPSYSERKIDLITGQMVTPTPRKEEETTCVIS
jgi:hypothetical protein